MTVVLIVCGVIVVLAVVGMVRDRRARQREWKRLRDSMGEERFRASLRRALIENMVDQVDAMKQADLDLGRELRDAGMERTLDHQPVDWLARYKVHAEQFLAKHNKKLLFTGEELRAYVLSHGLEQPGHVNAWSAAAGSVLRGWLRQGTIEQAGIDQCERPESHARLIRTYRKAK